MNHFRFVLFKNHPFVFGTLLLTAAGLFCRILGFFYRILLSRTIGAEGLGLYHLIHPVFGICFSLCAGSFQTALSQSIAAHLDLRRKIFHAGLTLSLSLSFLLTGILIRYADEIARFFLMEPLCAPYLSLIAISLPFSAFHACIKGYYYGIEKSSIPAYSQVVEQTIRMIFVSVLVFFQLRSGHEITITLAVWGHLVGELAAALFLWLCLFFSSPPVEPAADGIFRMRQQKAHAILTASSRINYPFRGEPATTVFPLLSLVLPLMGTRLVLNLLSSAEAVWIPSRLQQFGLTNSEAFSIYGVLTGMALPFIFFPSAIVNSMSVLLLPSVAKAQAEGKKGHIASSIVLSLRCSLFMGILCVGIFVLFGHALGNRVFQNETAGHFIRILAWLCPFLYLSTTMGSILNGLGRTRNTFFYHTITLLIRIGFVWFGIPKIGILAYLWGILASELLLAMLSFMRVKALVPFSWSAWELIGKPCFALVISIGIYYFFHAFLPSGILPLLLETGLQILTMALCYCGIVFLISS